MTRDEILKDFLIKSLLPILLFLVLFILFKAYFTIQDEVLYGHIWLYCSPPFGIWQMFSWINPSKFHDHRWGLTLFNIAFGLGFGGVFIFIKLAKALWYIPVSIYRLLQLKQETGTGTGTGGNINAVCREV